MLADSRAPRLRAIAAVTLMLTSRASALAQSTAAAPAVHCPMVEAAFSETIDTKKVKPGERFRFATLAPVSYAGLTIPAGTPGVGLIDSSDHSKSQGHSGYLILEARFLAPSGGPHVPVAFRPGGDGHSPAFVRAGSSDAGLIGYLPFYIGTAAGVYNTFHHGKDAAVVAGYQVPLIVGDDYYAGTCSVDVDHP